MRQRLGRLRGSAQRVGSGEGEGPFDRPLVPRSGNGVLIILSGVPIDDSGGGVRCTQIALEALRQGEAVVFINRFPKYESVELDLHLEHPRLLSGALSELDLDRFLAAHSGLLNGWPVGVLVEFAVPEFLPLIQRLRALGAVVAYDLLDDWDTSLGAAWYRPETELAIVQESEVLVATAPVLVERLKRISGRPVALIPNAVNRVLFDPALDHSRPADLPRAEWIALFFGALWGDWFDWDLLIAAAQRFPSAAFVLIGDYRGQCPQALPNLHFLGLKAQPELPAYLAHCDVAFVPWRVNPITEATSPIKVYEFLSMRKPVVTPWLPLLEGMPSVLRSRDSEEFLRNLERARTTEPSGPDLDHFLEGNSWPGRTRQLLDLVRAPRVDRKRPSEAGVVQMMSSPPGVMVDLPDSMRAIAEEHSSAMLDANELFYLAGALALMPRGPGESGLVVEIGAYRGRTSVFMARALDAMGRAATILSIDPFERVSPDPMNPQGSLPIYMKQVRSAGLEAVCVPMVAYSQDAAPAVPDRVGVLVVDGDHHYESVRRDLALYAPKLLPGGLVFVDDYVPAYGGVQKATDEFFDGNAGFTILHKTYFVIARKAGGAPAG